MASRERDLLAALYSVKVLLLFIPIVNQRPLERLLCFMLSFYFEEHFVKQWKKVCLGSYYTNVWIMSVVFDMLKLLSNLESLFSFRFSAEQKSD